eukprot:353838-Chlamydomonas_euryale.AAC.3
MAVSSCLTGAYLSSRSRTTRAASPSAPSDVLVPALSPPPQQPLSSVPPPPAPVPQAPSVPLPGGRWRPRAAAAVATAAITVAATAVIAAGLRDAALDLAHFKRACPLEHLAQQLEAMVQPLLLCLVRAAAKVGMHRRASRVGRSSAKGGTRWACVSSEPQQRKGWHEVGMRLE